MLLRWFDELVPFDVKTVLEPACGSGRLAVGLAKEGFQVTGYDLSQEMVEFATNKIAKASLQDRATVLRGDMASMTFDEEFDVAVNPINSIGYLLSDDDILSHLRNTATALRPGGVYLVQLGCADEQFKAEGGSWDVDVDGMKGSFCWGCSREDREHKLLYEYCRVDIVDYGTEIKFEDEHVMRLWFYDDLKRLIKESGSFVLEAIFTDKGEVVDMNSKITSEMGNLYYVLKVI